MRFIIGLLVCVIAAIVETLVLKTDFQSIWLPIGWCLVYFGEWCANGDRQQAYDRRHLNGSSVTK